MSEAPDDIVAAALQQIDRCRKLPIYICVRGYQGWLENAARDLGFAPLLEQAVMVKHLTAGVRQASFERVQLAPAAGASPRPICRMVKHSAPRRPGGANSADRAFRLDTRAVSS